MRELHLVKVSVNISKIIIAVKFPCSLKFHLRSDQQSVTTTGTYPLREGQCEVNQMLQIEVEATFVAQKRCYSQFQISLVATVASINGSIPVGVVVFNSFLCSQDQEAQMVESLQKCSDRQAKIYFTQSWSYIRKIKDLQDQNMSSSKVQFVNRGLSKNSSYNRLSGKQEHFRSISKERDLKDINDRSSMNYSRVKAYNNFPARLGDNQPRQRIRTNTAYNNNNESSQRKQKALKSQVYMQNLQIQKLRQKCRNYQRKERDLNLTIKDLKDNVDKKRNKVMESQSTRSGLQGALNERQKQIQDLKMQNKKLQERVEDGKIACNISQKSLQIKGKAFKEQLKIYSQKIVQLQKNINKNIYEYNSGLQKMQAVQKTNQLNNKQRQRNYIKQKTSFIKKIQSLNQQVQNLKQSISQGDTKLSNLTNIHKCLITQQALKTNQLNKLQTQHQVLKTEFHSQKNRQIQVEKQLQLLSSAQSDKNTFRKKYNQTLLQLTKTNEKHERLTSSHNQLSNKFSELDQIYKQLTKSNKQLNVRYSLTATELQTLKKQHSTLTNQFNALSAKTLNISQKFNDTKFVLNAQKQDFQEMQAHYEEKLKYLIKTKEYVEGQVQDWEQMHGKQQSLIIELQNKKRATNDQILSRHEEYLKLQENNKKAVESIGDLTLKIQHLQIEIQSWERKEKYHLESLKSKSNQVYELGKKNSEQELELFMMQEKIQLMTKQADEKHHDHEKATGQRDTALNHRQSKIEELESKVTNLEEQLQKTTFALTSNKQELALAESNIKEYLQTIQKQQNKAAGFQTQIIESVSKIVSLQQDLQCMQRKEKQGSESLKLIQQKWAQYREGNFEALGQLIDQMGRDQADTQVQLLNFQDGSLCTMQMTALKSRNETIGKYRRSVHDLQEQIQFHQQQTQKIKSLASAKQSELEGQILELKNRQSQLNDQWMGEKQDLSRRITQLQGQRQQLASQGQKLKSSIRNLEDIASELNGQKDSLQAQIQSRDQEISLLGGQILMLKSSQIKGKSTSDSAFKQFKQQTQQQIDKVKKTLAQTSQKLLITQNQKQEKQSRISELEKSLQQNQLEFSKLSNKKKDLESKASQLENQREELRSMLNAREKTIQDLSTKSEALKEDVSNLETKHVMFEAERKKTYENLTETQVTKEKLQKTLQLQKQATKTLRAQLNELESHSSCQSEDLINRINEQQDRIAKLESDVQLKSYVIQQLEKLKTENVSQIKQLNYDIEIRKVSLLQADKQIESLNGRIMIIQESQTGASIELQSLRDQNLCNIENITELKKNIAQIQPRAEELVLRLEEIQAMRNKITQLQDQLHKTYLQLQNTQNQAKHTNNKLTNKEQQYRKRIISLETEIAQRQHQSNASQAKTSSQWERQKARLMKQLQEQDKSLRQQQQQSRFRIDQLEGQIESLNSDCLQLSNLLNEKEEETTELQDQLEKSQKRISALNGQLRSCLQAWDKQKAAYLPSRKQMSDLQSQMSRFQECATELDTKTKQSLQVLRKKGSQESKFGITDILRDLSSSLSKSKVKVLSKVQAQDEKQTITTEYRQLQEKIDTAMRSQNGIYK